MTHVAVLFFGLLVQAPPEDPNTRNKPDLGFSISKPPKNDEWGFKDTGFFTNSKVHVAHKVDDFGIDILAQDKAPAGQAYDVKKSAESIYSSLSTGEGITDARKLEAKSTKLPGGGGGNSNAELIEMSFKKADKPMEARIYCFLGRQNQNLYLVVVMGEAGMYKKHQRIADFILSTFRVYKVK